MVTLDQLWEKQPPPAPPATPTATAPTGESIHPYVGRAVAGEQARLAASQPGERNHTLNRAAFSLAQLVNTGHISEQLIRDTLTPTALHIGLTPTEVDRTITSGIAGGLREPRPIPPKTEWGAVEVLHLEQLMGVPDSFWGSRECHTHVREFARARMAAPWAVLAACLLRATAAIPPHIVLPPTIGGIGSLNLLTALVGPSGAGKGAAEAAAGDAFTWPATHTTPLGSGEGILHAYAHPNRKKHDPTDPTLWEPIIWDHRSVLFTAPEIDSVAAINDRRGSTLMPLLRSAYSGERLGFQYADSSRRIILPAHEYRLGLSVGVQPTRGHTILDDVDGGTPQRFLWAPVTDPQITADPPPEPRMRSWRPPALTRIVGARQDRYGRTILPIPDVVASMLREAHAARARGDGDALDGHSLYTRLKVAHALAVLDGRLPIGEEDWGLAGQVMAVSDRTRLMVQAALSAKADRVDVARAEREGRRAAVAEDARREVAVKRVARLVSRRLREAGGEMPRGRARKAITAIDREYFAEAVDRLVDVGQVQLIDAPRGEVLAWQE